jgi:hypothetical protein
VEDKQMMRKIVIAYAVPMGRPPMSHPPIGVHHLGMMARHHFAFRHHRFFRSRFAVLGVGFPYAYDDGCYTRVWTAWGWRRTYICGY